MATALAYYVTELRRFQLDPPDLFVRIIGEEEKNVL
jgi:hypothetical protein